MKDLYFKKGRRYYPVHQQPNFSGFPSDGLFLVNNGYEQICPKEDVDKFGIEKSVKLGILVSELRESVDLYLTFDVNIDKFLDRNSCQYTINEKDEIASRDEFYEYYEKKWTTYKKVGETFNSFKSKGFYLIEDGKNNKCKKLDVIDKTFDLKFDKEKVKAELEEYLGENAVSYYSLVIKASKLMLGLK